MTTSIITGQHVFTYRTAVLFMIGSASAWGTGTVMSKVSLSYFSPLPLFVVQLTTSVAVLWVFTIVRRQQPSWSWKIVRLGWTGLLEPGLAFVLALIGLARTTASVATFIGATESFIVIVFACFLLRERVSRRTLLLLLVALSGVTLISVSGADEGTAHTVMGDILVLAGTASAALYVVLSSQSVTEMEPLPLCALQQSFGLLLALAVLPIGLSGMELSKLTTIPASVWLWAMLNGVVQYTLAFLFYLMALKGMPATRAALFLTLIPLFGVVESGLFLGEQMTAIQLVGGGLILVALVSLNRGRQQEIG